MLNLCSSKEYVNGSKNHISFVEDIRYKTLFNNLVVICDDIKNNNIDIAFDKIKDLMLDYKELYEFMS